MEEKIYCVYIHTNKINNKVYIGQTKDIKTRWKNNGEAYTRLNKNGKPACPYFAYAIIKYGWDNFSHEIIKSDLTKEEADTLEIEKIAEYDSTNPEFGYNIMKGGSLNIKEIWNNKSYKEQKREESISMWDNQEFKGHMIQLTKDRWANDEEYRNKMAALNYERWSSDDFKQKMSDLGKKRWEDDKYRQTIITKMKTTLNSEECKQRKSENTKRLWGDDDYRNLVINNLKAAVNTDEQKALRSKIIKQLWEKGSFDEVYKSRSKPVRCIETNIEYRSMCEAEKQTGVSRKVINRCCLGIGKSAGKDEFGNKLHWEFISKQEDI